MKIDVMMVGCCYVVMLVICVEWTLFYRGRTTERLGELSDLIICDIAR